MPGYADYQRTVNYDEPLFINEVVGGKLEKEVTRGRFDVSRFAYIMGKLQFTGQPVQVTLQWWSAETGGVLIGERVFRMDNKVGVSASLHVPNLGPWLAVVYRPESLVVEYHAVAQLFVSNRIAPYETIPTKPAILVATPFKLASKGAKTFSPEVYYAGPAELYCQVAGTAGFQVALFAMFKGFEYERFDVEATAGGVMIKKVILPFTAWNLSVENNSAAENEYFLTVVPSITGAS